MSFNRLTSCLKGGRKFYPRISVGLALVLLTAIGIMGGQRSSLDELIRQLSAKSAVERAQAASELARLGIRAEKAIPALIGLLKDETHLEWHRVRSDRGPVIPALTKLADTSPAYVAASALASIGAPAVPALLEAAANPKAAVRRNAAEALGQLVERWKYDRVAIDTRVTDMMVGLLGDKDGLVRSRAASAQSQLLDPRAFDPLMDMAVNRKENPFARRSAIRVLMEIKDRRASDALALLLDDPSPEVQASTMSYMGPYLRETRDPRLVEPLIRIIDRPNPKSYMLHNSAVSALAELGDKRALEPLIQLMERFITDFKKVGSFKDSAFEAAKAADKALARIAGGNPAGPAYSPSEIMEQGIERCAKQWRTWFEAERAKTR